jgi:hypothetical protein
MRYIIYITPDTKTTYSTSRSSIFWDITPCSPLKVNRRFGGKHFACSGLKNKLSKKPAWEQVASSAAVRTSNPTQKLWHFRFIGIYYSVKGQRGLTSTVLSSEEYISRKHNYQINVHSALNSWQFFHWSINVLLWNKKFHHLITGGVLTKNMYLTHILTKYAYISNQSPVYRSSKNMCIKMGCKTFRQVACSKTLTLKSLL